MKPKIIQITHDLRDELDKFQKTNKLTKKQIKLLEEAYENWNKSIIDLHIHFTLQ